MEINIKRQGALLLEQQCVAYRDLYFRIIVCLLAAHIMVMIGEEISSLKAFTILSYYPTLAINYGIALLLAYVVKKITLYLDRKYYWDENILLRAILQFGMGIVLVSLMSFFLVFFYFASFGRDVMASNYTKYELPFSIALITILNLFYTIYYFCVKLNLVRKEHERYFKNGPQDSAMILNQILVYKGAYQIPLSVNEIGTICKVENAILIYTFGNEHHVTDMTLEELEQGLDGRSFFRLNRQLIVHISACKNFEQLEFGKLKVAVAPEPPVATIVSQRKAPLYRKWIAEYDAE